VNLYLESSAVLRDLLGGDQAMEIRRALDAATLVVTSRLTIAEVTRVLARLRVIEPEIAARVAVRDAAFQSESELWGIAPLDDDILARCGRAFPHEPVRTLDAVHLATIEKVSGAIPDVVMLSTDERIRRNAAAFGFALVP